MTLRYPALAAVLGKKPWFNTPEKADQRWQARDEFHEIVAERDRYRAVAMEQWVWNHSEHCTNMVNEWPHPDGSPCHWPLPVELREDR